MMILPFSARLRGTLFTLTLTLLSGCALIQDEPAQVAIVNPQQAQLAQVIHLANSDWPAARWWEAYDDRSHTSITCEIFQAHSRECTQVFSMQAKIVQSFPAFNCFIKRRTTDGHRALFQ
ncbi:tripartite multidrug resistance system outer membrane protein [Klebsiella pneumoniae]|nr:hypothetical protein BAY55_27325 [Klebsiella pneumoniae]SZA59004.1 tripartite multidrug resistance system outer membrane protein [Klebsiella pneumoniae]VAR47353.1 tripartite multidrug resistance system outer membrane protein [Klebsiella pneumoniae]